METQLTTRREPEKVRLIDANALLEELNYLNERYAKNWAITECIEKLESAPIVDIAELKEKAKALDDINRKIRQLGNKGL